MAELQRIAKLLARAGIASRREIERMIADGRVAVDGTAIDTPATLLPSLRGVSVDGRPVAEPEHARLFLFHKPTGVLTAANDPGGRTTIYDRLPVDLPRLMPIGRLDLNTEGLLLLTNDGGLKRQLELPATGVERTYRARAYGDVTQAQLEELSEGIEIDGVRYGSIDANMERRTGANVWIELRLTEGKNREVRRVLEHFGLEVSRLIRVAYGPFLLADLPLGGIGEVAQHELVAFRKTLKPTVAITSQPRPVLPADSKAPTRRTMAPRLQLGEPANGRLRRPSPVRPSATSSARLESDEARIERTGPATRPARSGAGRKPSEAGRTGPADRKGSIDAERPARGGRPRLSSISDDAAKAVRRSGPRALGKTRDSVATARTGEPVRKPGRRGPHDRQDTPARPTTPGRPTRPRGPSKPTRRP